MGGGGGLGDLQNKQRTIQGFAYILEGVLYNQTFSHLFIQSSGYSKHKIQTQ